MSFASALFAVSRSYFIILFSACQELFLKSFFKIFSNLLHNFSVLSRFGLPLSCSDFFYYTQLFEFVKNFFQLFFKFVSFHFYVLNLFSFKPAALRRLVLLYTFLPFCQHLFWKKFQLFWKSAKNLENPPFSAYTSMTDFLWITYLFCSVALFWWVFGRRFSTFFWCVYAVFLCKLCSVIIFFCVFSVCFVASLIASFFHFSSAPLNFSVRTNLQGYYAVYFSELFKIAFCH